MRITPYITAGGIIFSAALAAPCAVAQTTTTQTTTTQTTPQPAPQMPAATQPDYSAAQPDTSTAPSGNSGAQPGNDIGTRSSLPLSNKASNITPADTNSPIAPTPPEPAVGADAGVSALLAAANQALASNQTGTADEALEQAETQILQRSVPQTQTDYTSEDPVVAQITQARQAIGNHDSASATQIINQILASAAPELSD